MGILRNKIDNSGQTLIEIVVAFGLIAVTMGGLFVLFINSLNLVLDAQDRTIAYNIASEGMEIVKQQRDEGCSLSGSLATGDYVIDKDIGSESEYNSLTAYSGQPIRVQGYAKDFKRIVKIQKPVLAPAANQFPATPSFDTADKYFMVIVEVKWKDKRGVDTSFNISRVMLNEWKNI